MTEQPIHIFCGADRNEMVPLAVLTHSLRRHSKRPIEVAVVDNHDIPGMGSQGLPQSMADHQALYRAQITTSKPMETL